MKFILSTLLKKHPVLAQAALAFALSLAGGMSYAATAPNTPILNTATASYTLLGGSVTQSASAVITTNMCTQATNVLSLLQYVAPAAASGVAVLQPVPVTKYSSSGTTAGPLVTVVGPTPLGGTTPLPVPGNYPLAPATTYDHGQPIFVSVTSYDQNKNPLVADTIFVTLTTKGGDSELLQLTETGISTGVFTGYIQSTALALGALPVKNDGVLSLNVTGTIKEMITATSSDTCNGVTSTSTATAMADPYGLVFSSASGLPLNGASITIVNGLTGAAVQVFGADGISIFPSTIVSGSTVKDSSGATYVMPAGAFRFPFVVPGNYKFLVTPPPGYHGPSTVPTATLQMLPGNPFAIVAGSRGENFVVNPGPALHIDIPLDPGSNKLALTKTVGKSVAAVGDFVPYTLTLTNNDVNTASGVQIADHIPLGFRYKNGSASLNGVAMADPVVSADASTLVFTIPALLPNATATIQYVLAISPASPMGVANNTAAVVGVFVSNSASASIVVRQDLFANTAFLIGRVIDGSCDDKVDNDSKGLAGARVLMENGTQVLTDREGRWHIDNVLPGTHVVQLDLDSLPKNYEVVSCTQNTRFAGRAYSQFVDVQGGTLWRADFHLQKKAPVALRLTQSLGVKSEFEKTVVSLAILSSTEVTGYSATVILPAGTQLIPGSVTLNGAKVADPEVANQALTFRSLARPEHWQDQYFFEVENVGPKATFKSLVRFTPPGRPAQNLPVAEVSLLHHAPATNGTYAEVLVEAADLVPAKTPDDDNINSLVEQLPYDDVWLSKAQPGTEWLHPQEDFHPNLPVVSVAVKHDPKQQVTLFVNGQEVSGLKFYGTRYNEARTVALSNWRAVQVAPGDNRIEMVIKDENGKEVSRTLRTIHYGDVLDHVEFVPEKSRLIADGKTRPIIAVRFLDKDGKPVRRGINGEFQLSAPYSAYDKREAIDRQPLTGSLGGKAHFEIKQDGLAMIELEPTTQSGEAILNFQFNDNRQQEVRAWLQAQQRDWVLVGFGEGSVGQKTLSGNMQALQGSSTDSNLYENNKLAFYAKGSIKGEYLMTIAYDTSKQTGNTPLGQAVNPNQYYTLYADATQASFDAASVSKLYVKLEKKQFYAMFGDFNTGLTVTELSRYTRMLNGVKSEYKGDTAGYNAFAAQTTQAYVRDEIPGNGTSGLYQLTRNNIMVNSDTVYLETRDRFQSQIIVSTQTLTRYLDYNIDYNLGTIVFTQPVPTRDASFNPTYIVAQYESNASSDSRVTAGGRASVKPLPGLEVGATVVHEGNVGASGNLTGTDVTYKLDDQTKIHAEGAVTNRNLSGTPTNGTAWVADVTHRADSWDSKAYVREEAGTFGMGQLNAVELATRKVGADGRYKLDDSTTLKGLAYQLDNITTGDKTTMAEARVDEKLNSAWSAYYGARRTQTQSVLFGNTQSDQVLAGTAYSMLDNRLTLRAGAEAGTGTVAATAGNATMPDRLILGADYKVTQQSKLFAEQEFDHGQQLSASTTRVGVRTQPWSGAEMSASVGDQFNNDAERMYGNLGIVQRWQINEHWQSDLSLDRSSTFRNTVNPAQITNAPLPSGSLPLANGQMSDYIATAFGAAYRDKIWSANGRAELRNSTLGQQKNLKLGTQRNLDAGRSVAVGYTLMDSNGVSTINNQDLRLSYAHRPNDSEWVWFDRADFISQFNQTAGVVLMDKKFVNNSNANWMPNTRTQLSLQYGAKYVVDNIGGIDYIGYTDLFGTELRYDLTEDWDIGGFATMMRTMSVGVRTYGYGVSMGYKLITNMWVSFGYNFRGMADRDFADASYRARGPFITLRMKIDQDSLGLNDHGDITRPLTAE